MSIAEQWIKEDGAKYAGLTLKEKAKKAVEEMGVTGQITKVAWEMEIEKALYAQAEDTLNIVHDNWKARKECLKAAAERNDHHSFNGHTYAMTACEEINNDIRKALGLPDDNQPDDRFDIGGFECNEKQEV